MIAVTPVEISIVRGILTLILMLTFISLVVWLYARKHKHAYDYAARLPLEDDVQPATHQDSRTGSNEGQQS